MVSISSDIFLASCWTVGIKRRMRHCEWMSQLWWWESCTISRLWPQM